jgi:hypothetical protein
MSLAIASAPIICHVLVDSPVPEDTAKAVLERALSVIPGLVFTVGEITITPALYGADPAPGPEQAVMDISTPEKPLSAEEESSTYSLTGSTGTIRIPKSARQKAKPGEL